MNSNLFLWIFAKKTCSFVFIMYQGGYLALDTQGKLCTTRMTRTPMHTWKILFAWNIAGNFSFNVMGKMCSCSYKEDRFLWKSELRRKKVYFKDPKRAISNCLYNAALLYVTPNNQKTSLI